MGHAKYHVGLFCINDKVILYDEMINYTNVF